MNASTDATPRSLQNYKIIAPISVFFALTAVITALFIIMVVLRTRHLHSINHFLMCNTSVASIMYCIVQCNNYAYLLFVTWDATDQSCRWRGYFGYLAMVACVYTYLLQVISRFIFIVLSTKYRRLISFRSHSYFVVAGWILIVVLPLPALVTSDIFYREGFLCWVPKRAIVHTVYIAIVYYVAPTVLIFGIYVMIYVRIYHSGNNIWARQNAKRKLRDFEIFRNIMISFSIYFLGGMPYVLFLLTNIEFFYSMGVISVTLAVAVEKLLSIYLDREIRVVLRNAICRRKTQVVPLRGHLAFVSWCFMNQ